MDHLVHLALRLVLADAHDSAFGVALQLPPAVGSLQAEGTLLTFLHAEVEVEAGECVIDMLHGGALHAPIVTDGRWYVKQPAERNISFRMG